MANHKSAKKRSRQTVKRNLVNKIKKSKTRTAIKKLRAAISENNKKTATELLTIVQSLLGKLSKSSAMKNNTASRLTSRLASQVNKL